MSYFPGAKPINIKLLFRKSDGRVLGAQATGEAGVERRIDIIATAIQFGGPYSTSKNVSFATRHSLVPRRTP